MYEQKGEIPPANVRRLGYVEIELQTESRESFPHISSPPQWFLAAKLVAQVRAKFIKACYDVHQPGSTHLARRTTGVSDGQVSPSASVAAAQLVAVRHAGTNKSDAAAGIAQ